LRRFVDMVEFGPILGKNRYFLSTRLNYSDDCIKQIDDVIDLLALLAPVEAFFADFKATFAG